MKKINLLIIALIIVVVLAWAAVKYLLPQNQINQESKNSAENMVGSDQDEHGCIGSAGYSWCEQKQKCLRIWEEVCDEATTAAIKQLFAEKYNKDLSDIQIVIAQQTENHLRGSVKFAMNGNFGEGGIVLAAKVDGKWQIVFDGNGGISCALVESFNFPAEMIDDCYRE